MQAHLDLRAAKEREVEVEGAGRHRPDPGARAHANAGDRVWRGHGDASGLPDTWQAPGAEGLAPLDAALNLPAEHYSHGVRRFVAEECARASFDEVVEALERRPGAHVPKRQVEELSVRAAQDFDAFYAERGRAAEDTLDLLILSFDGKGIAMRHEDLRPATRKAAETTTRRLYTRLTPGEKANRKRMAMVATVYTLAPWPRTPADVLHTLRAPDVEERRPKPVDKRVWASVAHTPQRVIEDAFAEALRRDPRGGGGEWCWSMVSPTSCAASSAPRASSGSR